MGVLMQEMIRLARQAGGAAMELSRLLVLRSKVHSR